MKKKKMNPTERKKKIKTKKEVARKTEKKVNNKEGEITIPSGGIILEIPAPKTNNLVRKQKRKIIPKVTYKGVSWCNTRKRYIGSITVNGKRHYAKAGVNASLVAKSVRALAVELRDKGLEVPKGYGNNF